MARDPSASSELAFIELLALARSDGVLHADEERVLERFRALLSISRTKAVRYRRVCLRRAARFPDGDAQQLDLLVMLARVAYSDGVLQPEERQFFARVAGEFGVSSVRLARVLEEAESEALRRRRRRTLGWAAAAAAVVVFVAVVWWAERRGKDEMQVFRAVDRSVRPALLLVHTRYTLRHPSAPAYTVAATGTGFYVDPRGYLLTNKHVVQPWRFPGRGLDLLAQGYRLDEDSIETLAWPEGTAVLDAARELNRAAAFSTAAGTLAVAAMAADSARPRLRRPRHLRDVDVFCHAGDDHDLALLRCTVSAPVAVAPLADSTDALRRLDPVMVLGYPRGLDLLESQRIESSPAVGRVRRGDRTIFVTAPIVGGNSGGPLLGVDGRVLGIATRTGGDATLACCIRIERGRALLDSVMR